MPIFEKVFSRSLIDAFDEFFTAISGVDTFRQIAAPGQVLDGLERQVRIHRARAVADQQAEVHDLARFAGLNNERDLGARFFPHQQVVHRRQRQRLGMGA